MKQKSNLKLHKYPLSNIILKNCSILGMYLFGGKFCKFMDEELGERECTCPEIIAKHPLCECDRKHFNNFLWATVTVFQVSLVLPPPVFSPPIQRLWGSFYSPKISPQLKPPTRGDWRLSELFLVIQKSLIWDYEWNGWWKSFSMSLKPWIKLV